MESKQWFSVQNVLAAIKPKQPREWLESNLAFPFYHLRKNFNAFMAKELKVSDSFQLLDCGGSQGKIVEPGAQSVEQTHLGTDSDRILREMRPVRPSMLVVVVSIELPVPVL